MRKTLKSYLLGILVLSLFATISISRIGYSSDPFAIQSKDNYDAHTITDVEEEKQEDSEAISNETYENDTASDSKIEERLKRLRDRIEVTVDSVKGTIDEVKVVVDSVKGNVKVVAPTTDDNKEVASAVENTTSSNKSSVTLDGFENQPIKIKGNNYCGQFAMSSVLKQMGVDIDPQEVYQDTNPGGIFTSPPVITEYLNKKGIKAGHRNDCSIDDIVKKLDSGKPVMVLLSTTNGVPHWVNIYGYTKNADGSIASFRMRDSYWGTKEGHEMPIDEFIKAWESPLGNSLLSKFSNYKNLMIDIDGEVTGGSFDVATEDNIAGGINDAVTGFKNKNWGQMFGGAAKLFAGIPGAVISLTSRIPEALGKNISKWGKEKIAKGGFGNKLIGNIAKAGGSVIETAGKIADKVGDAISKTAEVIGKGIEKVGKFFSSLW